MSNENERPGGWVNGIGWVARATDLGLDDMFVFHAEGGGLRVAGDCWSEGAPIGYPVIVARWADGTVPSAPVAPEPDGELAALADSMERVAGIRHMLEVTFPDRPLNKDDAWFLLETVEALAAGVPSTPQAPDDRQGDGDGHGYCDGRNCDDPRHPPAPAPSTSDKEAPSRCCFRSAFGEVCGRPEDDQSHQPGASTRGFHHFIPARGAAAVPVVPEDGKTFCRTCSGTAGWYCKDPAHEHVRTTQHAKMHRPGDNCAGCWPAPVADVEPQADATVDQATRTILFAPYGRGAAFDLRDWTLICPAGTSPLQADLMLERALTAASSAPDVLRMPADPAPVDVLAMPDTAYARASLVALAAILPIVGPPSTGDHLRTIVGLFDEIDRLARSASGSTEA